MKLLPRHIAFLPSMLWPTRSRLNFGGASTLHLQETALVIEGFLQRLFFPLVDRFFQLALSEWTTVTIPYSRILHYRYTARPLMRLFLLTLLWVALGFAVYKMGLFKANAFDLLWGRDPTTWQDAARYVILPGVVTLVLVFIVVRPLSYLVFRTPGGGRAVITFRIGSAKLRREFEEQLEANREASLGRETEYRPDEQEGAEAPLAVLAAMLAGNVFVYIWQLSYAPAAPPAKKFTMWQDYLPFVWPQLIEYLPFLLVAAALVYRGWATRTLGALALVVRGAFPLVQYFIARQQLPRDDWKAYVWPAFHLLLALVLLLTVPTSTKERE